MGELKTSHVKCYHFFLWPNCSSCVEVKRVKPRRILLLVSSAVYRCIQLLSQFFAELNVVECSRRTSTDSGKFSSIIYLGFETRLGIAMFELLSK